MGSGIKSEPAKFDPGHPRVLRSAKWEMLAGVRERRRVRVVDGNNGLEIEFTGFGTENSNSEFVPDSEPHTS